MGRLSNRARYSGGEAPVIPVTISFRDLSMTVVQRGWLRRERGRKELLKCVSADILPGRLAVVMGSSGAGKVRRLEGRGGAVPSWGAYRHVRCRTSCAA